MLQINLSTSQIRELQSRLGVSSVAEVEEAIRCQLVKKIRGEPVISTNCRGCAQTADGQAPLDGGLDGWCWHAWSGSVIAYGATEATAIEHLRDKLSRSNP